MFPNRKIQVQSPCLDCGGSLQISVRDGVIEEAEPGSIVGYVDVPVKSWAKDWPLA